MKQDFKIRPRISYITIAASDLQKSFKFYKDGLGFTTKGIKQGQQPHALFNLGNGLNLVLCEKNHFFNLTGHPVHSINSAGFIISHFADSREEVDCIVQKALKAGARHIGKIQDEPWWYAVNFTDPDGYQWEVIWEA